MEHALRTLPQKDTASIVIGFGKIARRPNEKPVVMSVSLSHTTARAILDALCQQDPENQYELIDGELIHV